MRVRVFLMEGQNVCGKEMRLNIREGFGKTECENVKMVGQKEAVCVWARYYVDDAGNFDIPCR